MEEFIRVFTPADRSPYVGFLDTAQDWEKQLSQAMQVGIAPQSLVAPVFVLWEITGRCPQNCIYCYNDSPKKVPELSPRRLFQVADQLINSKIFSVCLSGGEPMMRTEYLPLMEYLALSGMGVGTVLSGWGVDQERARRISHFTRSVQVSLDGSTPEIHDEVRRRKGSYHDAVNAIRYFLEAGASVNVSFAVTKDNIADFPNVYHLCEELGVKSLRTQKLAISGKAKRHRHKCADHADYERLMQFCRLPPSGKLSIAYDDPTSHISFGRRFGFAAIARITADGLVSLSPYLGLFFGDLKTENWADIWNRMRKGWRHPQVEQLLETAVEYRDEQIVDNMPESAFISWGNDERTTVS